LALHGKKGLVKEVTGGSTCDLQVGPSFFYAHSSLTLYEDRLRLPLIGTFAMATKSFFRGKTSRLLHSPVSLGTVFQGICEQGPVQNSRSFAKLDRVNLAKPPVELG